MFRRQRHEAVLGERDNNSHSILIKLKYFLLYFFVR